MPNAEEEVDFHYVCFINGPDGTLYELDGDLEGPFRRDVSKTPTKNTLFDAGLDAVRDYVQRAGGSSLNLSLLALVSVSGKT